MRPTLVINDVHAGVVRSAGTTPATAYRLRLDILEGFKSLLELASGSDVLINGDWLDKEIIPMSDLYAVWQITREWLLANPECELAGPRGNHDGAKASTTFTSFDLLINLLQNEFGARVLSSKEQGFAWKNFWVLGHVPNQNLFDLELSRVPAGTRFLALHANYDNHFAVESDHSLNLSPEQALKLPVEHIILGHVHQRSTHLNGKVLVVGNQLPSSVADCLGNSKKYALKIRDDKIEWIEVCDMADLFLRIDWRDPTPITGVPFVRIEGQAETHEAAAVVAAISTRRKNSDALVITNAVKIGQQQDAQQLAVSLDEIKSFKVLDALMEILDEEERVIVKKLLEEDRV